MSRIQNVFNELKKEGRRALVPFITAGDPAPELTVPLMHALVAGGADVIELGVPFSDPMADGPTIQRASERALAKGMSLRKVIEAVQEFRKSDSATPVVLMGYANPIEAMGVPTFVERAKAAGVDGVLVVDYPPEECREFAHTVRAAGLDPIFLLAPTSSAQRFSDVAEAGSGYIYYVSLKGVTGVGSVNFDEVRDRVAQIRDCVGLPIGVGFGIRDAQSAKRVGEFADAVVVGSRIIEEIENSPVEEVAKRVTTLVRGLRDALDELEKVAQ